MTAPDAALRLHMNENTAGCAPAVLNALRSMTGVEVAQYPDYAGATAACARWLGVDAAWLLLTNGLDDGLHAVANRARTFGPATAPAGSPFDAIVVEPAFEMFAAAAEAADGRVVRVGPNPDFAFPLERVLGAITPNTRLVIIDDPNNPTGRGVGPDAVDRLAARASHALVLVDEAYAEFSGRTLVGPMLDRRRNVVVGRTLAKAHGLAGLRAGVLVAHPDTLGPIRRRQPPFAVNAAAARAVVAALEAPEHAARFVAQAAASRDLVYDWCRRRGVVCWPSQANFVLVRLGPDATAITGALASRGILIRDKSDAPGCAGCVRIAAGVVEHTRRCLEALDDVRG